MILLTRREVIEAWKENKSNWDHYTCPFCRNIMTKLSDSEYKCTNSFCYGDNVVIKLDPSSEDVE
ncbi:MAG: hypothetical protein HS129_15270 [Leptospiraceae bacterium]|nr:hypothetical protein [Leptospiraceae bacterium]NUM40826.1 hypothetical protein [Leptospiraceae bacterium]